MPWPARCVPNWMPNRNRRLEPPGRRSIIDNLFIDIDRWSFDQPLPTTD